MKPLAEPTAAPDVGWLIEASKSRPPGRGTGVERNTSWPDSAKQSEAKLTLGQAAEGSGPGSGPT